MSNRAKAIQMLSEMLCNIRDRLPEKQARECAEMLDKMRGLEGEPDEKQMQQIEAMTKAVNLLLSGNTRGFSASVIDSAEMHPEDVEVHRADEFSPQALVSQIESMPGVNVAVVQAVMRVDFLCELAIDPVKLKDKLKAGESLEQAVQELWAGTYDDAHPTTDEPLAKKERGCQEVIKVALGIRTKGPMPPAGHA